jgi:DNA-binding transcriptional LysR family regulator
MRAIELRQLRYFSILARELHFGRAADLAFVTQSALSQQVARLEELVGVQLFNRDRRGVTLTAAGEALRDGIEAVFEQIDRALLTAREAAGHREFKLSIGMVEYTNLPFVPPALIRLQALYPDVTIERHEMNAIQQTAALATNDIDVGFGVPLGTQDPDPGLRIQPLLESNWALLMRCDHRLAHLDRLRLDDLAAERLIIFARAVNPPLYDGVVAHCQLAGFKPNFVYETMQSQVGINLVEQGLGVMLGATYVFAALPPALDYRLIEGLGPLTVHMFTRAEEHNPLILDFIELAAEEARRVATRLSQSAQAGS